MPRYARVPRTIRNTPRRFQLIVDDVILSEEKVSSPLHYPRKWNRIPKPRDEHLPFASTRHKTRNQRRERAIKITKPIPIAALNKQMQPRASLPPNSFACLRDSNENCADIKLTYRRQRRGAISFFLNKWGTKHFLSTTKKLIRRPTRLRTNTKPADNSGLRHLIQNKEWAVSALASFYQRESRTFLPYQPSRNLKLLRLRSSSHGARQLAVDEQWRHDFFCHVLSASIREVSVVKGYQR
jgi:hypothetical protein